MNDGSTGIVLLCFPDNEIIAGGIAALLNTRAIPLMLHTFPDGETLVTLPPGLEGRSVVLICTLDHPDAKLAPMLFAADAARECGALRVGLLAPYLAYMRQDTRFHEGEAVSSRTFAKVLSRHLDFVLTVDPHLHRYHTLGAVYDIAAQNVTATPAIADWLRANVPNPVLIGPDQESEQWTASVAHLLNAPYTVLSKVRRGDSDVSVSVPDTTEWAGRTPVLLDDILSTGRTMIAAIDALRASGLPPPVCVVVHAIMAGSAYRAMFSAGAEKVVSCNTIAHASNAIDVAPLLAKALLPLCE